MASPIVGSATKRRWDGKEIISPRETLAPPALVSGAFFLIDRAAAKSRNGAMNRRWIAVAVIVVAIIGVANIFILFILVPRWTKSAANSRPAPAATSVIPPPVVPATIVSPPTNTVAAAKPSQAAHQRPTPPPMPAGLHLERQVLTSSGNLRVEYFRDRQQGIRQIALQDVRNPSNQTVLAQYKRNAWVVVSPDDQWVALNSRTGTASGAQLYHRVSTAPLKYDIPEDLRAGGSELPDVVWQSYLRATEQDPDTDRRRVTIDAVAWEPDSHKVAVSVTPIPTNDDTAPPIPWTCMYDVTTKQVEPSPEMAGGPTNDSESDSPNESDGAQFGTVAAAETAEAPPPAEGPSEMEGEKFPATREEPITIADANELELSDIRYAINEMFARHGANFKDAKIKKTFSEFSWYQPRSDVIFEDIEGEFSDVEKNNLAVLRRCRDAKIAAGRRIAPKPIRGQPVEEESDGQRFIRGVLEGVANKLNGDDQ
jgi:hypothetical protein